MDPIEVIEKELRHLIDDVLSSKFGVSWTENKDVGLTKEWSGFGDLQVKANADKSRERRCRSL